MHLPFTIFWETEEGVWGAIGGGGCITDTSSHYPHFTLMLPYVMDISVMEIDSSKIHKSITKNLRCGIELTLLKFMLQNVNK